MYYFFDSWVFNPVVFEFWVSDSIVFDFMVFNVGVFDSGGGFDFKALNFEKDVLVLFC